MIPAYNVGIHLAVTNNVQQAVGQINQSMSTLNNTVNRINTQVRALRDVMNGHMLFRAGERILGGLDDALRTGMELNTQFARTEVSARNIAMHAAEMRRNAVEWSQTSLPDRTPADLYGRQREFAGQLGDARGTVDMGELNHVVPMLSRLTSNLAFVTGEQNDDRALMQAYRSIEAMGGAYTNNQFDPSRFDRYANALHAALIAEGGQVHLSDMQQATRMAGPSLMGMTPEALYPMLAELAVQVGASRAGTGMMALGRQFGGGVMTRRVAENLEHIGVLHHGDWHTVRGGGVLLNHATQSRLARETLSDPLAWVTNTLMPRTQNMSNTDLMATIFSVLGTQTAQRVITDMDRNNPQFWRQRELASQVPGVDAVYGANQQNSVAQNVNNLTAAWHGLEQVMTDTVAQPLILGLHNLTDALHYLGAEAEKHPQTAQYIIAFTAAFGGLLAVTGGLMRARGVLAMWELGGALSYLCGATGLAGLSGILWAVGAGLSRLAGIALLDLLGPTLTGVAIGLTGLAGVTGLPELGALLIGVAAGLAALYGLASHLPGMPGHTAADDAADAEATRRFLDQRRRFGPAPNLAPTPGHDQFGNPIHKESFHTTPPPARTTLTLNGSIPITADGRTIAQLVADRLTATLSGPSRGSFAPDPSISPIWGSQLA